MILRCFVVTVTRNRKGQPVRSGKLVAGDPITIGRSADSAIHLPDPRVHLRHGIIRNNDLGKLYVEANEAPIEVNGELQSRAKLRRGSRILIGPYQITPEPASSPDHDFGLAVELVQPLSDGVADLRARSRTTLRETWLPKRALAWALFVLVGALSLVLPLAYAKSARFRAAAASQLPPQVGRVAWDAVWNPGPLASGHESFSRRCDACHQAAFERVQDRACVKCHLTTGQHIRDASARAGVTLDARCAECHRDHRGPAGLVRADSSLCVDCHADLKARYPRSTLARVTDFASDHPPFALSMVNGRTGEIERTLWDESRKAVEVSGLKFTHLKHLAKEGVRSPTGVRVLGCAQCHKPDAANERFQAIKMEEICSECHRLEFEPAVTTRRAPHGKPELILTALREFYSGVALGDRPIDVTLVNELLRPPASGGGQVERRSALAWAEQKSQAVAKDLIETRVCVQCHEVSKNAGETAGSPWTIRPVKITSRWLPGANFFHQTHQQPGCEKCHAVRTSKSSADVSMPTLATCRECHAGAVAIVGKVRSPCETCHSFHQHKKADALFTGALAGSPWAGIGLPERR